MSQLVSSLAAQYDFLKVLRFAQDLIQVPSLSGQERAAVDLCLRQAQRLGFDEVSFDRMGNFIGRMKLGNGAGKKLVLTGHLDTVNADPALWAPETGPHSAVIRDDKLYGRGASDMKGAVAIMLHAAHLLKQLPPESLVGEVIVVGTVVEELFEGVCFMEALDEIRPDFVIVGEATSCKINIAQRGRAEILITVFGASKHASVGRTTINPIEQVAYVIDAFHRGYQCEAVELLGKRNIVPTDIKIPVGGGGGLDGRGGNSTVPNRLELTYDLRTLPGDTAESIMKLIKDNLDPVFAKSKEKYPSFQEADIVFGRERCQTFTGVSLEQDKYAPAWITPETDEIVTKALNGLGQAELPAEIGAYKFCTDGSAIPWYREQFPDRDIQIIGFGPSEEILAHVNNEFIALDQMKQALRGYLAIGAELLKA